ncbi:MAG: glycosyltransferase family 4 protein [Candidatus Beckwithbacteria bacterium]|nr:glycosyltransferase family 4 protein [Candidatus Beckwithbacteria bacterium]
MKILMLTPYLPYPLFSGGQIRSYNLLKNLSKKHEITLFSFVRSNKEQEYLKYLKPFCRRVVIFKRRQAWDPRNLLLALFTPYPFLVSIYLSQSFRQAISQELNQGDYDLIHAETFYIMPNLPQTKIPTLLVEQTIEYLVYQQYVRDFRFFLLKPLLYFDVLKINLWEKYYWRRATRLAAMSGSDKKIMTQSVKDKKVNVVANGVDAKFFSRVKPKPGRVVLFIGNFKWLPNRDAAQFLAKAIWPKISSKLPQAKLLIVGRNPTAEILKLAKPGIRIKGDVADIRTAFAGASVLLAPIRNGRGTKYKVLEAMASGIPVVTTRLGIEGIDAKDSVLVAESAEALAGQTINLLENHQLAGQLAQKAKKIVNQQYNWETISNRLNFVYQQLGGA